MLNQGAGSFCSVRCWVIGCIAGFFLLGMTAVTHAAEPASAGELQIVGMTFNIRYDNPNDGPDRWEVRKERVANLIRREKIDVVGLQEVLHHQLTFLAEQLEGYDVVGVGRDDGKEKGEYSPIMYRSDRFEKLDEGTFWLSETPNVAGSRSWDAAITRICTWVKLKERTSERTFYAFNTHFDHQGETARRESATLIRREITGRVGDTPWFLTGDFNAAPDSVVVKRLIEAKDNIVESRDSISVIDGKVEGPNSTWCGFRKVQPGRRIDYIFVDAAAKVSSHRTIVDIEDERFPSDHLPVRVEMSWKESP